MTIIHLKDDNFVQVLTSVFAIDKQIEEMVVNNIPTSLQFIKAVSTEGKAIRIKVELIDSYEDNE